MAINTSDIIGFSQARANFSEIAEQVKAGAEKIITKNGESYVAIIDASRLDYYHQLERETIHLLLLKDVQKSLEEIDAGQSEAALSVINRIKNQHA